MKFILFYLFLFAFVIFSYLFIDPNFFYLKQFYTGFQSEQRLLATFFYSLFILVFFAWYFYFLKAIKAKRIHYRSLLRIIIISGIVLLFSYPAIVSFDIFNYIATAKTTFFYLENPYIVMPIEFTNDPILGFLHAANKTALYGVSWIILSAIPFFVGFGNFLITLFAFKIFVALFYFATIYLLWKMTKDEFTVSLFALNPLVLIETFVSGHNDIVMMFFALLSFYALFKKKVFLSISLLLISILIKYATLFLLPVYGYMIWCQFKKRKIDKDLIFLLSFLSMFSIFLLSPVRNEMYPWYGIWFLVFVSFIKQKIIILFSLALTIGLSLRYIPFMYLGTHFWITPVLKIIITLVPLIVVSILLVSRLFVRQWSAKIKK